MQGTLDKKSMKIISASPRDIEVDAGRIHMQLQGWVPEV